MHRMYIVETVCFFSLLRQLETLKKALIFFCAIPKQMASTGIIVRNTQSEKFASENCKRKKISHELLFATQCVYSSSTSKNYIKLHSASVCEFMRMRLYEKLIQTKIMPNDGYYLWNPPAHRWERWKKLTTTNCSPVFRGFDVWVCFGFIAVVVCSSECTVHQRPKSRRLMKN